MTAEGKTIKNEEILALLKALWKPNKVAITQCLGHQKSDGPIPRGSNLAYKTTREVVVQTDPVLAVVLVDPGLQPYLKLKYSQEDMTCINVSPYDAMSGRRVALSLL